MVFNGWGYGQPGSWGNVDDNRAGRVVNGGTLRYVGAGYTASAGNRGNWTVGTLGATFESASTGAGSWGWGAVTINFTAGWDDLNMQGTVTLTGSSNGDMQKQLIGAGGLTKDGTGIWTIGYSQTSYGTRNATYAGGTTINNGTLQLRAR